MLHIVLYQPEIPPNTGNIIRLSANMGATLHLIYPLGFSFEEKQLRRAGLDYHEFANVKHHKSYADFKKENLDLEYFACSTKGKTDYTTPSFKPNTAFIFGPETKGLPTEILNDVPDDHVIRIPMKPDSRSLNLSNATAIILYEAWRQLGFS